MTNSETTISEREKLIQHLQTLRDDWKDEIPNQVIHSDNIDKQYKVRGNWFQGIIADIDEVLCTSKIKVDKDTLKQIDEIIDYFCNSVEFKDKLKDGKVDKIDIELGNYLIDLALKIV